MIPFDRNAVLQLARDAGAAIMAVYVQDFAVEHKDDRSPLTAADMAAHHLIVAGLRQLTPGVPVLSEESATVPWEERQQWHAYWLVDPLDGTREFVKKNPELVQAMMDASQNNNGEIRDPRVVRQRADDRLPLVPARLDAVGLVVAVHVLADEARAIARLLQPHRQGGARVEALVATPRWGVRAHAVVLPWRDA